jgi:hypothetical protein
MRHETPTKFVVAGGDALPRRRRDTRGTFIDRGDLATGDFALSINKPTFFIIKTTDCGNAAKW